LSVQQREKQRQRGDAKGEQDRRHRSLGQVGGGNVRSRPERRVRHVQAAFVQVGAGQQPHGERAMILQIAERIDGEADPLGRDDARGGHQHDTAPAALRVDERSNRPGNPRPHGRRIAHIEDWHRRTRDYGSEIDLDTL
jgi:hypothetical protein